MVVVDELLQLRIEILFLIKAKFLQLNVRNYFSNFIKYGDQTMFGGALGILHVECYWFHLEKSEKKRKKMYQLSQQIPILNFKPRNGYVVASDLFHSPQECRFLVVALDAILDVEKIEKSLSILYRNKEKLRFIVNNKIYSSGSIY